MPVGWLIDSDRFGHEEGLVAEAIAEPDRLKSAKLDARFAIPEFQDLFLTRQIVTQMNAVLNREFWKGCEVQRNGSGSVVQMVHDQYRFATE